jgi:hypothetical protein
LLLAVATANAVAIGNVVGVFNIGFTVIGTEGNLAGRVYGHANETAALIVCHTVPERAEIVTRVTRAGRMIGVLCTPSLGAADQAVAPRRHSRAG